MKTTLNIIITGISLNLETDDATPQVAQASATPALDDYITATQTPISETALRAAERADEHDQEWWRNSKQIFTDREVIPAPGGPFTLDPSGVPLDQPSEHTTADETPTPEVTLGNDSQLFTEQRPRVEAVANAAPTPAEPPTSTEDLHQAIKWRDRRIEELNASVAKLIANTEPIELTSDEKKALLAERDEWKAVATQKDERIASLGETIHDQDIYITELTKPPATPEIGGLPVVELEESEALRTERQHVEELQTALQAASTRSKHLMDTVRAQDAHIAELMRTAQRKPMPAPLPHVEPALTVPLATPEIGGLPVVEPVVEPKPAASNGKPQGTRKATPSLLSQRNSSTDPKMGWDEFDRLVRSEMKRLAPAPNVIPGYTTWNEKRDRRLPLMLAVIRRYSCNSLTELATKLGMGLLPGRTQIVDLEVDEGTVTE